MKVCIQLRDRAADGPVGVPHADPEPPRNQKHRWNDRERDRRQARVHGDQDDDDPQQLGEIGEDQDDARGERLVDRLDVGRHARHQAADGSAVEKRGREALEVGEDGVSQVEDDVLTGPLQQIDLEK